MHPTCVQALESEQLNTYIHIHVRPYSHEMSSQGMLTGLQRTATASNRLLCAPPVLSVGSPKSRLRRPSAGAAFQAVTKRKSFYYNVKVSGIFIYRNTLAPFQNGANRISSTMARCHCGGPCSWPCLHCAT